MTEILEQAVASVAPTLDFTPAPGFDIIIIAGQSNTAWGWGAAPYQTGFDPLLDAPDQRIWQFGRARANAKSIILAAEPLEIPTESPNDEAYWKKLIGFGLAYAKQLLANGHPISRNLLLVPTGVGSTGFASGKWKVDGDLYTAMRDQALAAVTAAGPNARFHSFVWCQGEADYSMGGTDYAKCFDNLVQALRGSLKSCSGGADIPVLVLSTNPDYVNGNISYAKNFSIKGACYVHRDTPRRVLRSSFTMGASGNPDIHYSAAAQRVNGKALANSGLRKALQNDVQSAPVKPWDLTCVAASNKFTLTWSPAVGRATGYSIAYKSIKDPNYTVAPVIKDADAHVNVFETPSLPFGIYEFSVSTINENGTSKPAIVTSVTQSAKTVPVSLVSIEGLILSDNDKYVVGANDIFTGAPNLKTVSNDVLGFPALTTVDQCKMVPFGNRSPSPASECGLRAPNVPDTGWSVSMLVRFDNLDKYQHLFCSSTSAVPWYFWRSPTRGKGNFISFAAKDKFTTFIETTSNTPMEINKFYAVTATVEGLPDLSGSRVTLYQNGAQVSAPKVFKDTITWGSANIGRFPSGDNNKYQYGYWASIRTDRGALPAEDVARIHSDLASLHGLELKDGRIQAKV